MANDCDFSMKVVAKEAEAIKRLISILNYKDSEYELYRVSQVEVEEDFSFFDTGVEDVGNGIGKDGDFFIAYINGRVAWNTDNWFDENREEDGLATMMTICKALKIGVEVFGDDVDSNQQYWHICDKTGSFDRDTEDYNVDDDGEPDGGVNNWMKWSRNERIYDGTYLQDDLDLGYNFEDYWKKKFSILLTKKAEDKFLVKNPKKPSDDKEFDDEYSAAEYALSLCDYETNVKTDIDEYMPEHQ